jgi:hypothetical protein
MNDGRMLRRARNIIETAEEEQTRPDGADYRQHPDQRRVAYETLQP